MSRKKKKRRISQESSQDTADRSATTPSGSLPSPSPKLLPPPKRDVNTEATAAHRLKKKLAVERQKLPVHPFRQEICKLVAQNPVVLVMAETGSGKSTQIPAYLLEGLPKSSRICVTQPRRVAAMTVAKRVAQEWGCPPGTTVGHRVRFDDFTSPDTRLIYATDGMLLREATIDPLLSQYAVVVLDEAHERSLQTDILFGVVHRAIRARSGQQTPLKVIVMSATLDVETFRRFFPQAATISIPGRQYPVQVVYTEEPQDDYMEAALDAAMQIHEDADEGDVLIFLPGQEEIESLALLLRKHLEENERLSRQLAATNSTGETDEVQSLYGLGTDLSNTQLYNGVLICVLYAALPPEAQMLAFQPKPKDCTRKMILSTNIAETSVTLDGIRYVIDTGKHKMRDYSGATGMETLQVHNISKAQARQRTGRAGRVSAGICFRLYTQDAFDALDDTTVPEVLRVNLAQVVLQLKGMGIQHPSEFEFLTPPSTQSLKSACNLLYALNALDEHLNLTEYGRKLSRLPLDPVYAHLLLQSTHFGCVSEMLTAVSMLSADNVFYRPSGEGPSAVKAVSAHKRFASYEGDLPTLVAVYNAWRKEAIYDPGAGRKGQKRQRKALATHGRAVLLHGDWCSRNYINGRALVRAFNVRHQLSSICARGKDTNGLGMDVERSCGEHIEVFLKCACAGLFLQSASRIKAPVDKSSGGRSGIVTSSRGKYRTKVGGEEVSIHPMSSLFGRNPAPKCVVYTEVLTTKRTYIRGVSQVREEWLIEVAPKFFGKA